jgi:hypothetical protein
MYTMITTGKEGTMMLGTMTSIKTLAMRISSSDVIRIANLGVVVGT